MAAASPSLLVTAVLTHTSVLPYSGRGGARRGWREGEREREGSVDIQELVINDNFTTHLSSMIPPFLPLASTVFPSPPLPLSDHDPVTTGLSSGNGAAGIDGEVSGGREGGREGGRVVRQEAGGEEDVNTT